MKRKLIDFIKYFIPESLLSKYRFWRIKSKYTNAKKIFDLAEPADKYLGMDDLKQLQLQYPKHIPQSYAEDALDKRGKERTQSLLKMISRRDIKTSLEIACWDGMVSYHLAKNGIQATATDIRDIGFDKRAVDAGVKMIQMNADKLEFADNSFDLVLSYDAFEHIAHPDKAFAEAYRVTKPGGYIYLNFGPLYLSTKGLHIYGQVLVPYCQILFDTQTLQKFMDDNNMGVLDLEHCNGWRLEQFNNVWKQYEGRIEKVEYIEHFDYEHINLLEKYAPHFKRATNSFDDLVVNSVELLFRKTK
jgi:ubiquinone/menaquinone biosynthesis C-methylase UbiE